MINDRITSVKEAVNSFCLSKGLSSDSVKLVVVTKTASAEQMKEALLCGISDIGESRIQDSIIKFSALGSALEGVRKHFIGHLQTNKAKKAVELFGLIQSLDSLHLAREINKHAANAGKIQDCLVEIKVSSEAEKYGVLPAELEGFLSAVSELKNIRITGLMAMAPYFDDPEDAAPYFKTAKRVFDEIAVKRKLSDLTVLSMGMSNDYLVALREGSNMIRIGTTIFGSDDE